MKQLKFEAELYSACAPRHLGNGMYTCDAWRERTGRVVKSARILNALGWMLVRGKDRRLKPAGPSGGKTESISNGD
ncbi:hypothetical protein JCM15765_00520 [Paradesulfitobacterium aromaticivorans]